MRGRKFLLAVSYIKITTSFRKTLNIVREEEESDAQKSHFFPLVNNQQNKFISSSLLVQEKVTFCMGGILYSQSRCLNWINSLISHNSSGYAFSSLLSILPYAMMEMDYLGSAEF